MPKKAISITGILCPDGVKRTVTFRDEKEDKCFIRVQREGKAHTICGQLDKERSMFLPTGQNSFLLLGQMSTVPSWLDPLVSVAKAPQVPPRTFVEFPYPMDWKHYWDLQMGKQTLQYTEKRDWHFCLGNDGMLIHSSWPETKECQCRNPYK